MAQLKDLIVVGDTIVSGNQAIGGNLTLPSGDVLLTKNATSGGQQVKWSTGANDYARVYGAATASNSGYLELATADDANEPIYARQYTGNFATLSRTATLLDASGNTSFPGTVTATTFSGNLTGNCSGTAGGVAWTNVSSKPTTISGYGITDAKIASGVITLGSNTITPLTAASTLDAAKVSGTVASATTTSKANLTTTQYGIAHYTDTAGTFGNNPCLITTSTGGLEVKGTIAGDSGTSGHGLYSGGGFHNAYNNVLLHGDETTGSSGIAFISDKITPSTGASTSINQPSDRAFIQYHAYGITTATAEGTAPTIATSGEKGRLVIGIGNDADDQVWLQTPGRTGLIHQVGASSYAIPDTNNTTGSVGSATQPIYSEGAILKVCTYSLNKTVPSDAVFTDTKNTAGSTDTSSKIYLVGATSQAANPQTYSDNEVYTTSGVLTTKSVQVGGTAVTMQYNSTDKCVEFVFS